MSDVSLEAKICVLGAQGVGKTSLVQRYVKGTFTPPTTLSTIGASFLTKRAVDVDSGTTVRLQVWDTAGQERFRSISKLYYRGASAVILVYSIIDEQSFKEMGRWLQEIKQNLADDIIIHVVGTKSDVVAQDPSRRAIPFERCIAYVAENLHPTLASTPPPTAGVGSSLHYNSERGGGGSKRNSGFWIQDVGWDVCHEISSSSGEGIEEVFRVVTRKLVERRQKKLDLEHATEQGGVTPGPDHSGSSGYFDSRPGAENHNTGSFRVGVGDKRRSWLGFPTPSTGGGDESQAVGIEGSTKPARRPCC